MDGTRRVRVSMNLPTGTVTALASLAIALNIPEGMVVGVVLQEFFDQVKAEERHAFIRERM